jgi:hypothetical protein
VRNSLHTIKIEMGHIVKTYSLPAQLCKSSPSTRHGGVWVERRYSSYSFTILALCGGEWSASRPGRALPPGKGPPGTHCTGGWVGSRAGLDTEATGKILCPFRGSNRVIALKSPSLRPGLNPLTFGWMVSTLTITPSRWHSERKMLIWSRRRSWKNSIKLCCN